jgi:hypothetical protein
MLKLLPSSLQPNTGLLQSGGIVMILPVKLCSPLSNLQSSQRSIRCKLHIWARLADEYGAVSELRRAHAEASFHTLLKKDDTPIQDHINTFTKLQQEVDYHRGSIPLLSDIQVNLAFLRSLGESAKTFQQSMGARIHTIKPSVLR